MLARLVTSNRIIVRGLLLGALLGTTMALTATAQPGREGGPSPEERAKIDAAKVGAVAAELKLDAEKSAKVSEAYAAHQKDAAANRPGFGRGDRGAVREAMQKRQTELETALKGALDEAQAKEAAALLGGLNRGWDRMVGLILGFDLGAEKEPQALAHTVAYVKTGLKAREGAAGSQASEDARAAMVAAKKTLDENLAPLLSEEQKAAWTEGTSWGGRDRGDRRDDRAPGAPGGGDS